MLRPSFPVVLASASPRRKELLGRILPAFEIDPAHLDEDALTVPDPKETAESLATAKAELTRGRHTGSLVIGADTVVALPLDGEVIQLSKPTDPADAVRILSLLSGRTHNVITGVAVVWPFGGMIFSVTSGVTFHSLSGPEIEAYVATGEPLDKAGAYGAQAHGKALIAHIEGSLNNVIGLPVEELEAALQHAGLAESV